MEHILITGGNGMIGSHLVERLLNKYEITVIDRYDSNLLPYKKHLRFVECDMRDINAISNHLKGVRIAVHLAAAVHWRPKNERDRQAFFEMNKTVVEAFIRACSENNVGKALFFSTSDVYADSIGLLDELSPVKPKNIYGQSKYEGEKACLGIWRKSGFPVCIFRPASAFGKFDRGNMSSLVALCRKGIIPVVGDGNNQKALAYVKDIGHAVELYAGSKDDFAGEVFNLSSGNYTFNELVGTINKVFGYKAHKVHMPRSITNLSDFGFMTKLKVAGSTSIMSGKRIESKLGYIPQYNLYEALKDCSEYYGGQKCCTGVSIQSESKTTAAR